MAADGIGATATTSASERAWSGNKVAGNVAVAVTFGSRATGAVARVRALHLRRDTAAFRLDTAACHPDRIAIIARRHRRRLAIIATTTDPTFAIIASISGIVRACDVSQCSV